jgi:hypothetical protein
MSDLIETKVIDTYLEHPLHTEYDEQCSECFKERNHCLQCGRWSDGYSSCQDCIIEAESVDIGI